MCSCFPRSHGPWSDTAHTAHVGCHQPSTGAGADTATTRSDGKTEGGNGCGCGTARPDVMHASVRKRGLTSDSATLCRVTQSLCAEQRLLFDDDSTTVLRKKESAFIIQRYPDVMICSRCYGGAAREQFVFLRIRLTRPNDHSALCTSGVASVRAKLPDAWRTARAPQAPRSTCVTVVLQKIGPSGGGASLHKHTPQALRQSLRTDIDFDCAHCFPRNGRSTLYCFVSLRTQ